MTERLNGAPATPDILAQMDDDVAAFDALPEDIKRQTEPIWPRDGVGGSITPSDEITITPAMQKLNTLLGGWPVGGSITPADQEDTEPPAPYQNSEPPPSSGQDVLGIRRADQEDTDG